MADNHVITRSVFRGFVPAAAAEFLVILTGIAIGSPGDVHWHTLLLAGLQLATLSAGFGLALATARERVAHAPRLGLRSAAAGLLAPLGLAALSGFTQGATTAAIGIYGVAAGAVAAGLLVASTFRRQKPESPGEDPELREEIARLDAELASPRLGAGVLPGDNLLAVSERVRVAQQHGRDKRLSR